MIDRSVGIPIGIPTSSSKMCAADKNWCLLFVFNWATGVHLFLVLAVCLALQLCILLIFPFGTMAGSPCLMSPYPMVGLSFTAEGASDLLEYVDPLANKGGAFHVLVIYILQPNQRATISPWSISQQAASPPQRNIRR
jgi:hypothetical protein